MASTNPPAPRDPPPALHRDVLRALADGPAGDGPARALRVVCAGLGWDVAVIWRRRVDDGRLRSAHHWSALAGVDGVILHDLDATSGGDPAYVVEATWQPSRVADPAAAAAAESRAARLHAAGVAGGAAVPLAWGSERFGVLEVLSREPRPVDAAMLEALADVALAIALDAVLDDQRGLTRSLAVAGADALLMVDADGDVVAWNDGARALFRAGGVAERAVLTDLVADRDRPRVREALARLRDVGPIGAGERVEVAGLRADGVEFPAELSLGRWAADDGRGIGVAVRDVSDRVTAEAAERIVAEVAALLSAGAMDTASTLRAIADSARSALDASRATCYELDSDTRIVTGVYTTEPDPERRAFLEAAVGNPPLNLPIWRRQFAHPDPLLAVEDVRADPSISPRLADRIGAGAFIAIRLEHPSVQSADGLALLGVLFLSYSRPRVFSAHETLIMRGLASLATLALANARLYAAARENLAEAEARAAHDPLTGLANHRTFHETLGVEVARAVRHDRPLSLVLLDLDNFKLTNDAHGHRAGDDALTEVAHRLQRRARPGDLVARLGGDEFAWLMPDCDGPGAHTAAEGLREEVRATAAHGVGPSGFSAGVCELARGVDAEGLYRLADGALYWAKAHGRGRVVLYSPEQVDVLSAEERVRRLERSQAVNALRVLARAVDAKDPSTHRHSTRVADLAVRLATVCGWDAGNVALLHEAGLVHDVGKIGVPDRILFKRGRLEPAEYEVVKEHAALGAKIVADVLTPEQVSWVRSHHERHDGRGYPDGLAAEAIPAGARILAVADAWDVMTSERPYSAPMEVEDALAEAIRESGRQFAPEVVEALVSLHTVGAFSEAGASE